jgi:hypothetical protein
MPAWSGPHRDQDRPDTGAAHKGECWHLPTVVTASLPMGTRSKARSLGATASGTLCCRRALIELLSDMQNDDAKSDLRRSVVRALARQLAMTDIVHI